MENEKLILAGPSQGDKDVIKSMIQSMGDGHIIVGQIKGPEDFVPLMKKLKADDAPTTAIVFDYSEFDKTKAIVWLLRKAFDKIEIVTWGVDDRIEGVYKLDRNATGDDLKQTLLLIKH